MAVLPNERRNFHRMTIDADMEYKPQGSSRTIPGKCKNLSADGAMFSSQHQVEPGTLLDISIRPDIRITGPLNALFEVTRIVCLDVINYEIAGVIKDIKTA